MLRNRARLIWPLVCTAAVLGAAPATALASGGSPLHPDASPATSPATHSSPATRGSSAPSGGLRPDSPQAQAATKAAAKQTLAPSAPVAGAATPHVASTPSAPKVARPATRPAARHATAAPPHLGVRYALPPPFGELSRGRLLVPAALALLMLLLSSGSFLGLVYRHRRELVGA